MTLMYFRMTRVVPGVLKICTLWLCWITARLWNPCATGRVALVSDACARGSFLCDVAANITQLGFDDLDAPPYEFDHYFFPRESWILDAIHQQILPLPGYVPSQS